MGNDGGDIPKRKQLVKEKSKVQVASVQSIAVGRYILSKFFQITLLFKEPLAFCRLGCIYNYENILAALVQKTLSHKYSYIKKLTDIKIAKIERTSGDSENYICCPITKLQYNGFNKFVGLWNCGHIFSRKAFKQVRTEDQNKQQRRCLVCQDLYLEKDVVDLNLEPAELQKKRAQLILAKKQKKKQQRGEVTEQKEALFKKEKIQFPLNSIQRLGGQFRDLIRDRKKFKELFGKKQEQK